MKPGDEYLCPHCGKNSFLKKETVMDGWTKKGDVLKCASCGTLVCELKEHAKENSDPLKSSAADKFKSLLGDKDFVPRPKIELSETDSHFCKDCAFLIPHPFVTRCSKTGKDVNPMDDCPDFSRRKE